MKYCAIILLCIGMCYALPAQIIDEDVSEGRQSGASNFATSLSSIIRPVWESLASGINSILRPTGTRDQEFEAFVMRVPGSDSPVVLITQDKNEENLIKTGLPLQKIEIEKYEDVKEKLEESLTKKS